METIFLQKSTEKLNLSNGQFVHREGDVILKTYPVLTIEQVFVYGNGQITTQALKECLRNGIRVLYFNAYGKFLGRLEPDYPKNIQCRRDCNGAAEVTFPRRILKITFYH